MAGRLRRGRTLFVIAAVAWTLPPSLLAEAAREAQITLFAALPRAVHQMPLDWGRINQEIDLLVWVSVLAGRALPIVWLMLALVTRSLPAVLTEQAAADGATARRSSRRSCCRSWHPPCWLAG